MMTFSPVQQITMSEFSLINRPRRLRKSAALRDMFQETSLSRNDLALPIFVEEGVDLLPVRMEYQHAHSRKTSRLGDRTHR